MNPNLLFIICGIAFLAFLFAALELSRLIRKQSGEWQKLATEAESETSPLMGDGEAPETALPVAKPGKITPIFLPRAPGIIDQVFTHSDWDGIFSGALLKYFSPLARVEILTPRGLKRGFKNLARSTDKPKRLFIADLVISSADLPEIEDSLIDLARGGMEIYWYDHHPWSPLSVETVRRDCKDLIVDSSLGNAAEIVRRRLFGPDAYADKLLRLLGNQTAPEDEAWGVSWKRLISATQSSGLTSDLIDLIGNLAANRPFTVSDRYAIGRMAEAEERYKKFAQKRHREETTRGGQILLVVDLRTFRMDLDEQGRPHRTFDRHTPPTSVGHEIVEAHRPDVYIMVLKNDRLSLRSGHGRTSVLTPILGIQEIAGQPVQVAGHNYAAGVYLTVGLKSKLRSLWDWSLPQPVEDFIKEVKEKL
jgi:hypothetical protein